MTPRGARWLVWALALAPPVWAVAGFRSADLAGPGAVLNLLGRMTGIAGLSMLLLAAILSCRVPGVDQPFGGLTKLWKTHHSLGAVSFLMLLAHPVLLALAAADNSLPAAAQVLVPPRPDVSSSLGWLALLAMMIFLAPSFAFFGEPNYQRWRWLHRLAALTVIAALAHTFLLARTIPPPASTIIWLLLSAGAVASVAYRLVFSRRVGRLPYAVQGIAAPAGNVVELTLRPMGRHLDYVAGQFIYLTPYDESLAAGYREEHPYTLTSAPGEPSLRVAIKDLGDATHAMQSISPASEVRIEGPYGAFFPRSGSAEPELWIAGGIGIAPFLGRLRDLAARNQGIDAHLVYCVQDKTRAHFGAELEQLVSRIPGAVLTMHYFYRQGPLDASFLLQHCRDFVRRQAFVCGPEPLIERAQAILAGAGVARRRIVTEEFTLI